MRALLLLAFLAIVCARHHHGLLRSQQQAVSDDNALWFDNLVDHFDPTNTNTYKQKYYVNDTFWNGNGPLFLLLGGEGPIAVKDVRGHFVFADWGQEKNALLVAAEHRFYGDSLPTADLSTENLRLLSARQALADYANLLTFLKGKYGVPSTSHVVTFGGSYSGALSAWMRELHPDVVSIAYGTSGPVLAKLDFNTYFQTVTDVIGPKCGNYVQRGASNIVSLYQTAGGRQTLRRAFNVCDSIDSPLDFANFLSDVYGNVAGVVQYNNDNIVPPYFPTNVDGMCQLLTGDTDPVDALVNFTQLFTGSNQCNNYSYASSVQELQDVRPNAQNPGAAGRAWTWQTCNEFGYYQTAEGNSIFPKQMNLQFNLQLCIDVFNVVPTQVTIDKTNKFYGGLNLKATRVILPNGSGDPWHNLGILNSNSDLEQVAIYMNGTAHCADLYGSSPNDLPSLTEGRQKAKDALFQFLSQPVKA